MSNKKRDCAVRNNNNNNECWYIQAAKDPNGVTRKDGERPDGLTLIPWKTGKPIVVLEAFAINHSKNLDYIYCTILNR